jgi:hypothetical protein
MLTAHDANDQQLGRVRVAAGFKLNKSSANAWIDGEFSPPK